MYSDVVSLTAQLYRTTRSIWMHVACIRFKRRLSQLVKTLDVIFCMTDTTARNGIFENSLTLDTFVSQVE